jgi:iron complex outermembrane receptor protein
MNSKPAAKPSRLRRSLLASGIAISLVAIGAPIAFAQVAEVVVTARKRDENVQNIPVAVTSVSGKQLEKFNITSVEDVAQQTPQLIIARASSGSGADISLRGIGTPTENIGIEQSVSVNIDGIYYGQGRVIDEGTFDVSGVQVLKGPQALFYGKNSTAGALAITTNDPTSKFESSITAGYQFNAEEPYVEGYISGPVTDTLGLRFAGRFSDQQSGYITNTAQQGTYDTVDIATGMAHSGPTAVPPSYLGGDQDILLRFTAKWQPLNNLTVTLKATYDQHRSNNNVDNSAIVYCPLGYPQTEEGLPVHSTCGQHFSAPEPVLPLVIADVPGSLESLAGGQDFERYQSTSEMLKVNYNGANYTLTSTSGFQHMFNDWADNQNFTDNPQNVAGAFSPVYAGEHFVWNQFSTEERLLTSFSFPVNFAGGFYFQTTHLQFAQDVDFLGAQDSAVTDPLDEYVAYNKSSATTGHTYAVFGQAIWDIVKNVELTCGARFTHEIKSSYFLQPYVWAPVQGLFTEYNPNDPGATSVGAHQVFDNWSPEATLTWKPMADLTLYGAYKTGYKSGGFSDSAILSSATLPSDFQFKPETAKGFELGEKAILFDHQLRFNVDVFDYLYSNLQVDFFNTPTFNYVTLNAASARTYGVEYEAEYAPTSMPGLTLHVDGAFDEAHYLQFESPCSPAGLTYEQGCNALRVVNPNGSYYFSPNCGGGTYGADCNFMNVNGQPTALSPKWTAVIGGDYTHEVATNIKMSGDVNVRVSSGYVTNSFTSALTQAVDHQNAYGMLDAALSIGGVDDRWKISVIGRNLTNAFVQTSTGGLPESGGTSGCRVSVCGPQIISDQLSTILDPRTVAIQLTLKY